MTYVNKPKYTMNQLNTNYGTPSYFYVVVIK